LLRADDSNVNALSGEDVIEVAKVKSGNVSFEKSITLSELVFDTLSVTPGSQGLPMPILLMARSACGRTSGAPRVFRIALDDN
jgi:hypothetical protein